jgi:hypothetical protein
MDRAAKPRRRERAVFDLEAGPVTVTLPDAGNRFMSMQVISQDHYTTEVVYGPGRFTYAREKTARAMCFCSFERLPIPKIRPT